MLGNIKSFEKPFTHAEVVALAERTLKRFGGDRNAAGRYARAMEDRYESAKWAQVVEVIATSAQPHATRKTPRAQLNREIAAVLAAGPTVKILVHEVDEDEDEDEDEHYVISDDGGEFDDSEETLTTDVQGNIDERRAHYRAMGRRVVIDVPPGRDWR